MLGQPRFSMRPGVVVSHEKGTKMGPVSTRENTSEHNLFPLWRTLQFLRLSHYFLNLSLPQPILHYPNTLPIFQMRSYSPGSLSDSQGYQMLDPLDSFIKGWFHFEIHLAHFIL